MTISIEEDLNYLQNLRNKNQHSSTHFYKTLDHYHIEKINEIRLNQSKLNFKLYRDK